MNDSDSYKPNWSVIRDFERDGVLVQVSASDARRPRYTVRVGRRGERGIIPFLQCYIVGQGKVSVRPIATVVYELLAEAETFVQGLAQEHEDKYLAEKIQHEERGATRDGKKRRPSGYKQARRQERGE